MTKVFISSFELDNKNAINDIKFSVRLGIYAPSDSGRLYVSTPATALNCPSVPLGLMERVSNKESLYIIWLRCSLAVLNWTTKMPLMILSLVLG